MSQTSRDNTGEAQLEVETTPAPVILFVDEEVQVLQEAKNHLRPMRKEWTIHATKSAKKALAFLNANHVDVLVTAPNLSEIPGLRFLKEVLARSPGTVRIVLSPPLDNKGGLGQVLPAHQFMSRPCSQKILIDTLKSALRVRALLEQSEPLQKIVSRVERLPTLPRLYQELTDELNRPAPSLKKVATIIASDVAMSAKILKLVNSPFFGFFRHIGSPEQAVTLLGTEVIRSLVLSEHVFSAFDLSGARGFSMDLAWEHSLRVGHIARSIATSEGMKRQAADELFIAGLLHDMGKLILIDRLGEKYGKVLAHVQAKNLRIHKVEQEKMGADHGQVGGFLMALWGLGDRVVDALAWHHAPGSAGKSKAAALIVHVANVIDHKLYVIHPDYAEPEYDTAFLEETGFIAKLPDWEGMAEVTLRKMKLLKEKEEDEEES